jgi:O-antigen/teichoic acid export membrane protein
LKTSGLKARADTIVNSLSAMRETLVGAFGVMIIAVVLSGAINYLFNIVMNRLLGKTSFGDLYSLETVFLIVVMGALSIQTVITKYVAEFDATGNYDRMKVIVRSFSRWLLLVAGAVVVASAAVAWPLAEVLKLESPLFIVILGTAVAAAFYVTLPNGILQGRQYFLALGGAMFGNAALRIIVGVVLVLLGLGVYGALGAGTIAGVVVTVVVLYLTREMFVGPAKVDEDFHPGRALRYLVPVALAMFFIILLSQMDVVLVKALFSRTGAGDYAYAALAGKAVLFLPDGISLVMFPRVSELKAKGEPTRRVLLWSLAAVTVMVSAVAGFYALFPGFTAYFFAGARGESIASLVGLFGLVMALFAVVKLLAFYHLALEKRAFIWLFVVAAVAETAGIILFHDSLSQVVVVMLFVGLFLLVTNLFVAFREAEKINAEDRYSCDADAPT